MKLNNKIVRTLTTTAVVAGAAAMLSVGAFAAEADINDPVIAGYMPPQDQMIQGDIALHSIDYAAPLGDAIQGDIMLISAGDLTTTLPSDTLVEKAEAHYTVKGLFGKEVLYTAHQEGRVLTLSVPENVATFRTTVQDMQTLLNQGVSTLVLTTNKTSTTLNLTLLVEGYKQDSKVTLHHCGTTARLTINGRNRRDLLIGR